MRVRTPRAVSPVVAVILMVAVTVILSAVIGTFVLDLGQTVTSGQQSTVGVSVTDSSGTVSVTVITGTADKLKLLVNGTVKDSISNVSPGDSLSADATGSSDVVVVSVDDGDQSVVSSENPIDAVVNVSSSSIPGPTDGLIAYYPIEEGSGGTAYESVNSNNGTITNALWTASPQSGEHSLKFDGSGDSVEAPHTSTLNLTRFTVSAWVKFDTVTANAWQAVVMKGSGGGGDADRNYGFFESKGKTKIHYSFWRTDGTWASYDSQSNVTKDTWYHIVAAYNGSAFNLYINGTLDASYSESGTPESNSESLYIGTAPDYSTVNGSIDSVRIYNQSLNASEVQDLYNATK